MNELSEEQINFIKKLYFYYGQSPVPSLARSPFSQECKKIFPQTSGFFHSTMMNLGWVVGHPSSKDRKFTEKFIREVIGE